MDITPRADDLWEGIAGHFDSFSQVVSEFVDNSISNFDGKRSSIRSVHINIEEIDDLNVMIQIEDTGSGISDFEPVIRLGDRTNRESPLNEHGFGLKHALATANPDNNSWKIYTRTSDEQKKGEYRLLEASYAYSMKPKTILDKKTPWLGEYNGSGTIVQFVCSKYLFDTLQKGIQGRAGFTRCLDYLLEELGYLYSGVIEKGKVTITVGSKKNDYRKMVQALKPNWQGFYTPNTGVVTKDLGGGDIQIEYQFGEMGDSNYVKHYKRNMDTSGVEIRINGRVIMSNVFKDIWQLENHPSYNHFLVIINLISDNHDALPKTRTSKNGIRSGDEKLEALFNWIRSTHPTPHKDLSGAVSERELVKELEDLKNKHIRSAEKHVEREFKVFTTIGSPVVADLYVYDGADIVIYEAKKDQADVQNVYQLLMYWDGAVADRIVPTEGILIASSFSPGVANVLTRLNATKDQNGNYYKFSTKTWHDERVNYPKP